MSPSTASGIYLKVLKFEDERDISSAIDVALEDFEVATHLISFLCIIDTFYAVISYNANLAISLPETKNRFIFNPKETPASTQQG